MKIGVVTFPGSLDDRDAQRAIRLAGAEPVALWHADHDLQGVEAIVLPGGFSYGDYLRPGAIAAVSPIMTEVIDAANSGRPVLGTCNGSEDGSEEACRYKGTSQEVSRPQNTGQESASEEGSSCKNSCS